MHILYRVIYLPHLNTRFPKYYIGSKYNYKGNYFGSVASIQVFDYTNNLPLTVWWKSRDKQDFVFEILESFDNITPLELVEKERDLHLKLNVLSEEYFNMSIATKGYCSVKNTKSQKIKKSISTKRYWDSPEGKLKKERMSERNRRIKPDQMKNKWKNPTEKMKSVVREGRPKGAKDLVKRKIRVCKKYKKVNAKYFKVSYSCVQRRCQNSINGWFYI